MPKEDCAPWPGLRPPPPAPTDSLWCAPGTNWMFHSPLHTAMSSRRADTAVDTSLKCISKKFSSGRICRFSSGPYNCAAQRQTIARTIHTPIHNTQLKQTRNSYSGLLHRQVRSLCRRFVHCAPMRQFGIQDSYLIPSAVVPDARRARALQQTRTVMIDLSCSGIRPGGIPFTATALVGTKLPPPSIPSPLSCPALSALPFMLPILAPAGPPGPTAIAPGA